MTDGRTYTVGPIAGDGIGQEVVPAATRVVDALAQRRGCTVSWREREWASAYFFEHARMMPADGIAQLVDALAAALVLRRADFDVIVAPNVLGDMLSDLVAALVSSITIAPGANTNPPRDHPSIFEPVYGSTPDIAGRGIANPVGQLWSASMMLDHLGVGAAPAGLMTAVDEVMAAGVRAADPGDTAGTDAFSAVALQVIASGDQLPMSAESAADVRSRLPDGGAIRPAGSPRIREQSAGNRRCHARSVTCWPFSCDRSVDRSRFAQRIRSAGPRAGDHPAPRTGSPLIMGLSLRDDRGASVCGELARRTRAAAAYHLLVAVMIRRRGLTTPRCVCHSPCGRTTTNITLHIRRRGMSVGRTKTQAGARSSVFPWRSVSLHEKDNIRQARPPAKSKTVASSARQPMTRGFS